MTKGNRETVSPAGIPPPPFILPCAVRIPDRVVNDECATRKKCIDDANETLARKSAHVRFALAFARFMRGLMTQVPTTLGSRQVAVEPKCRVGNDD